MFVTFSVTIVLVTQLTARAAFPLIGAMFLAVIAPMGVLLFMGVRSGRWSNADVSVREERKRFYPVAIPISAVGTWVMWLIDSPGYILRGGIVTVLLLVVAAVINLRFKISLHMLFAAYCTVILFKVNVSCGIVALILASLVFWSRLVLLRHTVSEMIAGLALGATGGVVIAWI